LSEARCEKEEASVILARQHHANTVIQGLVKSQNFSLSVWAVHYWRGAIEERKASAKLQDLREARISGGGLIAWQIGKRAQWTRLSYAVTGWSHYTATMQRVRAFAGLGITVIARVMERESEARVGYWLGVWQHQSLLGKLCAMRVKIEDVKVQAASRAFKALYEAGEKLSTSWGWSQWRIVVMEADQRGKVKGLKLKSIMRELLQDIKREMMIRMKRHISYWVENIHSGELTVLSTKATLQRTLGAMNFMALLLHKSDVAALKYIYVLWVDLRREGKKTRAREDRINRAAIQAARMLANHTMTSARWIWTCWRQLVGEKHAFEKENILKKDTAAQNLLLSLRAQMLVAYSFGLYTWASEVQRNQSERRYVQNKDRLESTVKVQKYRGGALLQATHLSAHVSRLKIISWELWVQMTVYQKDSKKTGAKIVVGMLLRGRMKRLIRAWSPWRSMIEERNLNVFNANLMQEKKYRGARVAFEVFECFIRRSLLDAIKRFVEARDDGHKEREIEEKRAASVRLMVLAMSRYQRSILEVGMCRWFEHTIERRGEHAREEQMKLRSVEAVYDFYLRHEAASLGGALRLWLEDLHASREAKTLEEWKERLRVANIRASALDVIQVSMRRMESALQHAMRWWVAGVRSIQGERKLRLVGVKGFANIMIRFMAAWLEHQYSWGWQMWREDLSAYKKELDLAALREKDVKFAARLGVDGYKHNTILALGRATKMWVDYIYNEKTMRRRQMSVIAGLKAAGQILHRHATDSLINAFTFWDGCRLEQLSIHKAKKRLHAMIFLKLQRANKKSREQFYHQLIMTWLSNQGRNTREVAISQGELALHRSHIYHSAKTLTTLYAFNEHSHKEWGWERWQAEVSRRVTSRGDKLMLVARAVVNFCDIWRRDSHAVAFSRWMKQQYQSVEEKMKVQRQTTLKSSAIIIMKIFSHRLTDLRVSRLVAWWRLRLLYQSMGETKLKIYIHLVKLLQAILARDNQSSISRVFTLWCAVIGQAREDRIKMHLGGNLLYIASVKSSALTKLHKVQMLSRWYLSASNGHRLVEKEAYDNMVSSYVTKSMVAGVVHLRAQQKMVGFYTWRYHIGVVKRMKKEWSLRLKAADMFIFNYHQSVAKRLMSGMVRRWCMQAVDLSCELKKTRLHDGMKLLYYGRLKVKNDGLQRAVVALLTHALECKRLAKLDADQKRALKEAMDRRCAANEAVTSRAISLWGRWSKMHKKATLMNKENFASRQSVLQSGERRKENEFHRRVLRKMVYNCVNSLLNKERLISTSNTMNYVKTTHMKTIVNEHNRVTQLRMTRGFITWKKHIAGHVDRNKTLLRTAVFLALKRRKEINYLRKQFTWRLWIDSVAISQENARIEAMISGRNEKLIRNKYG